MCRRAKRMKKLCLTNFYCCSGEIYKLLDTKILVKLISQISTNKIIFNYKYYFMKKHLLSEEKLLLILDKYIGYVRDTYHIKHYELVKILEETLKNKYNRCLLNNLDIHTNVDYFKNEFKKMFLDNIIQNTINCAKDDINKEYKYLDKAFCYLNNIHLESSKDLEKIEKYFISLINRYDETLYYLFKINLENNQIFMKQLNLFYEDN